MTQNIFQVENAIVGTGESTPSPTTPLVFDDSPTNTVVTATAATNENANSSTNDLLPSNDTATNKNEKVFFIAFFSVLGVFILFLITSAILLLLYLKKRKIQMRSEDPMVVQERNKQRNRRRQMKKTHTSPMSAVDHVPSTTTNTEEKEDEDNDSQTIHTNADDLSAMLSKSTKSQLISRDELLARRTSIEDQLTTQKIIEIVPVEDYKQNGAMGTLWGALLYSTTLSEKAPLGGNIKLILAPPVLTITQRIYDSQLKKKKKKKRNNSSFVDDDLETGQKCKTFHVVEDTKCSICTRDYKIGDMVCFSSNRKCTHTFHKACIVRWLSRTPNCPTCWRCYLDVEANGYDFDDTSITS